MSQSARSPLTLLLLLLASATLITGCGDDSSSQGTMTGAVRVDGSSTVYPITEAVAEEFSKVQSKVNVTVGVSGTGGGFKRFAKGETDISDASRPIKKAELDIAREGGVAFIEIPVAYDGLSIVVPRENDWCESLTVDDLKRIFLDGSKVTTWKDLRPEYPAVPLKIYAPGTDSGTFDYFKEVVAGSSGSIRSDMSVSEDDNNLVRGVAGEKGGLGFFGCAYYFENLDKLRAVPIDDGAGPVSPSKDTIENGTYTPFSRPLFIYVNVKSLERPEVAAFVAFYLEKGPALAEEVGYVRLPDSIMTRVAENFAKRKAGTQFLDANGEKRHGPLPTLYM